MADEKDEVHPRDEINDDVRSAIASLKGEEPPAEIEAPAEQAEPAPEVEAKTDDRPRGPDGKFLPKESAPEITKDAAPEVAAAPAKEITPPTEDVAKASAPQPSTAASAPPVSWAADAKSAWASLPPAIQTAVLKRETEASSGFKQYSEQVRRYETAISPIAQAAQRRGIPVEEGIQRLAAAQDALDRDPRGSILRLAQSYGVDLAELVNNPPAPQQQAHVDPVPPHDPRIDFLLQRINTMDMDQNMGVVKSFADANPYYARVEEQLPDIMTRLKAVKPSLSGADLLKQAYDFAVFHDDTIRQEIEASKQQQAEAAKTQQVAAKAAQAAKAAVSVRGSSSVAPPPPKPEASGNSVYDDVRAAIAQHRNG